MVSLKWGDVLSTLLPGALALFSVAPYFPTLDGWIRRFGDRADIGIGIMLLGAAALAGGVLEAITRIFWERHWLTKRCKGTVNVLGQLTAANLELYERGVQSSYKYVTFYANFAWACALLLSRQLISSGRVCSVASVVLVASIAILLRASHVQWQYYVNYKDTVFKPRSEHAGQRSAPGDDGSIHAASEESGGL